MNLPQEIFGLISLYLDRKSIVRLFQVIRTLLLEDIIRENLRIESRLY